MNDIIFKSYDDLHKITIKIDNNTCWFNIDTFNNKNCKTFLMLIKEVIDFINIKNIKHINQYIYSNDCQYFKNSTISKYINSNEIIDNSEIFIISTQINHFVEEMINVLGIKKI